ncbi:MAG: hypothetical protein J5486_10035 [Bacteroidaceae bacterium]|nr:hypothetical protein [Bacteroidaceae bacterium]
MTHSQFQQTLVLNKDVIAQIRQAAADLHASVNQTYDKHHPYSFHLDMVADAAMLYGHETCISEHDVLPLVFGAYFHDSIEDARLTYNDVMHIARRYMDDEQALIATEIVYALTNDKGRTRAERAGENYYAGIRSTPYAPLVKLCDRYANCSYSFQHSNDANVHMCEVYRTEMAHFLSSITAKTDDQRFTLPPSLLSALQELKSD